MPPNSALEAVPGYEVVMAVARDHLAATISEEVAADDVTTGFYADDLRFPIAADELVVFDDRPGSQVTVRGRTLAYLEGFGPIGVETGHVLKEVMINSIPYGRAGLQRPIIYVHPDSLVTGLKELVGCDAIVVCAISEAHEGRPMRQTAALESTPGQKAIATAIEKHAAAGSQHAITEDEAMHLDRISGNHQLGRAGQDGFPVVPGVESQQAARCRCAHQSQLEVRELAVSEHDFIPGLRPGAAAAASPQVAT